MSDYNCFPKRPNKYEDEDELLRLSRQFEGSEKITPSASLVKGNVPNPELGAKKPISKFAQSRQKDQLKRGHSGKDISHENKVGTENPITAVLKDSVVEKVMKCHSKGESEEMIENDIGFIVPPKAKEKPFPDTLLWDKSISAPKEIHEHGVKKKMSIFAQQLSNLKSASPDRTNNPRKFNSMIEVSSPDRDWGLESIVLKNSQIIDAKEAHNIHLKNEALLNSMTEEQILDSRKEIFKDVNPCIVEFLRNKWSKTINETKDLDKKDQTMSIVNEDTKESDMNTENSSNIVNAQMKTCTTTNKSPEEDDSFTESIIESHKFVNMDKFEHEKMEWMADVADVQEQDGSKIKSFNARFDFNGHLLPYVDNSVPVSAGLHHHGEEPARPGYTLEELLTLARSTFPQQRCIAFDTLGHVIKNAKEGRYDYCFGTTSDDNIRSDQDIKDKYVNILIELLEADLVTLLRLALDEAAHTSSVVLDSSLNCLAQIVDNEIEELALDKQFFIAFQAPQQPSLKTNICSDPEFLKDEKEMKDIQIMKSDLILGMLRMDILDRFSYLLSITKPSNQSVVNILKILSRMCRHSLQTASIIARHPKLLNVIIDNFLPSRLAISKHKGSIYDTPVHNGLKLIRILMSWGRGFASEMIEKFDLGSKLLAYCSLIPGDSSNPVTYIQGKFKLLLTDRKD